MDGNKIIQYKTRQAKQDHLVSYLSTSVHERQNALLQWFKRYSVLITYVVERYDTDICGKGEIEIM